MNHKICYIVLIMLFISCSTRTNNTTADTTILTDKTMNNSSINAFVNTNIVAYQFRYNLSKPDLSVELPKVLKEISGLDCYQDKWLLAVQDEKGVVFVLDKDSGNVLKKVQFADKGDFEGIVSINNTIYVLRADGVLFKIDDWENKKNSNVNMFQTELNLLNNSEGLDYDPVSKHLLIACKGSSSIYQNNNSERTVFSYNLKKTKLNNTPVLNITIEKIKKYAQKNIELNPNMKKYLKGMEKKDKSITIAPSAIAVHPISKNYYILSAIGRSLIVMNRNNEIIYIEHLSPKDIEQPEGITFSSNGDMYICSEGQKQEAKVYKFNYIYN